MYHIRIWAYDGILASGVTGPIDVFTTANSMWAGKHRGTTRPLEWRIESPDGKPVRTASGQRIVPTTGWMAIDGSRPGVRSSSCA